MPSESWLDKEAKQLIVEQALQVLERAGIWMRGSKALGLLADRGAIVDQKSGLVRLPAQLVLSSLEQCPRGFLLAAGTADEDVLLGEGQQSRFTTGGCAARTLDMRTQRVRPSTLDDLRHAVALCDMLGEISVVFTPITATDVAPELRELAEYAVLFAETGKHHILVNSPRNREALSAIAQVLSGDADAFRARPRFTTLLTVSSPLQVEGELLDFHAAMAAMGAPVAIFPAPISGANAPVTVAGSVTQALAEFLGAASAIQLLAPGAKLLFGSIGTVLDMCTAVATFASPEAALISVAGAEVAHHLGLPVQCAGLATSANYPGIQAGYEKALKGLATVTAGADLVSGGPGMLESGNLFSLPQLLIDAEMAAMILRIDAGVPVSTETVMREAIERGVAGGDFLREKETSRLVRAGVQYRPRIGTCLGHEVWMARGRSELEEATEQVARILDERAGHVAHLSDDQRRELQDICGVPIKGGQR